MHFDFGRGQNLYEVLACTEVEAAQKRVAMGPLQEVAGTLDLTFFGNFSYNFYLGKSALQERLAEIKQIESVARTKNHSLVLVYEFPARVNPDIMPAKTMVLATETSAQSCQIQTFHLYPNDQRLVVTKTTIAGTMPK